MAKCIASQCARAAEAITIIGLLPMVVMLFQEFGLVRMFQDEMTSIQVNVTLFGLAASLVVSGVYFVLLKHKRFSVYVAISGALLLFWWVVISAVSRSGI